MHKLFANCHSISDFYKKLIEIENDYTPSEFFEIWSNKDDLNEKVKPLVSKTISMLTKAHAEIRPYKRLAIAKNVQLYQSESNTEKSLLICFCGIANRLMLPIPVFLQLVPDDQFDVLVMRDPTEFAYLNGVPGFGSDLLETSDLVKKLIDANKYNDVRCLGTSGGGSAALYFGILLNASAAFSVAGKHRTLSAKVNDGVNGVSGLEFDCLIEAVNMQELKTQLFAIYGEQSERDREGALSLQKHLHTCKLVAVQNIKEHNILNVLFNQNLLTAFFKNFIFKKH